jgi:hypothetical protein
MLRVRYHAVEVGSTALRELELVSARPVWHAATELEPESSFRFLSRASSGREGDLP